MQQSLSDAEKQKLRIGLRQHAFADGQKIGRFVLQHGHMDSVILAEFVKLLQREGHKRKMDDENDAARHPESEWQPKERHS